MYKPREGSGLEGSYIKSIIIIIIISGVWNLGETHKKEINKNRFFTSEKMIVLCMRGVKDCILMGIQRKTLAYLLYYSAPFIVTAFDPKLSGAEICISFIFVLIGASLFYLDLWDND